MFNNPNPKNYRDVNECTSRGVCSTSPILSALQELIYLFSQQSAHYLLKLRSLGINNESILKSIIEDIANLIFINEFSDKQLFEISLKEYTILSSLKSKYTNAIENEPNSKAFILDLPIEFDKNINQSAAISLGEKLFLLKYNKSNSQVRNLTEILYSEIKCLSYNLLSLSEYSTLDSRGVNLVLNALSILNKSKLEQEVINSCIKKLAKYNCKVKLKIAENLLETFGPISKKAVSFTTRQGKAILVSGNNLFDLMRVLDLTENKGIDVYTNSNLIIAHCLDKFRKYDNLIGHFASATEGSIVDFATFPGAILLADTSKNSSDYLYRGRIYSNDYVIHPGVTPVLNGDYTPLLDAALNSKGFKKGRAASEITLGFDKDEIIEKFKYISQKLQNGELNHLYIIGINYFSESQKHYFEDFFT
ncbi:hypothetical protein IJ596_03250, partial [bacterium]|nr:hypothetical protein [bacterium]